MPPWLRRILPTALLLLGVLIVHRSVRNSVARMLGRAVSVEIPSKGPRLRLVTWNVRNFPDESDAHHLAARLSELDADVVALQELRDPKGATALLPDHVLHTSTKGGRGGQHVGIAFNPTVLDRVGEPLEHASLSMDGRVRPALSLRLRHLASGFVFDVVVVHLKATPRGHAVRGMQWPHLAQIIESSDAPAVFVLGDFNVTGPPGGTSTLELAALDEHLGQVGLRRLALALPCTAYWEGARRDAWKEPSVLDLVWVRGPDAWEDLRTHPWGPCARYACQAFRSPEAHPDPDLLRGSDHCPVSVDVPLGS
jgi:endonuclease/exonuclease/phosphatase family metal-dependent hydrolase